MSLLRIRLSEADRDLLCCDEELVLDFEALKDLSADELAELDAGLGWAVAPFVPLIEADSELAHARRVAVWLALRQAGHATEWEKCNPHVLRASFELEVPSGPPDGPSETSSEGEAAANS